MAGQDGGRFAAGQQGAVFDVQGDRKLQRYKG